MFEIIKRIFFIIVILAISLSLGICALNVADFLSFSDVPESHWAYQTVMDMTLAGYFEGTSEPVNGVGTFSPDKEMTRAEFVTVTTRILYSRKAFEVKSDGGQWWKGYYDLAVENGILKADELDGGDLSKPMTREEMALIAVRCVEKSGECLLRRVETSQIADYSTINDFYKAYVIDCFSYGIICGVDSVGTFAPNKSLTRAEAATVLLRIANPSKRIVVDFLNDIYSGNNKVTGQIGSSTDNGSGSNDVIGGNEPESPGKFEPPIIEVPETLPWDNGGKQPVDYTWEEFEALSSGLQLAFQNSFGSDLRFDEWMQSVRFGDVNKPWENGGKKPQDYTFEEFEALTAGQQVAFQDSFSSFEEFDAWLYDAMFGSSKNPWENGGKKPRDYTWEEFEALTAGQQVAFQDSFGNFEDFEAWMYNAMYGSSNNPWENGGKKPNDYTWEEFEVLTAGQQIAFQEAFGSLEAFDKWLQREMPA